MQKLEKKAQSVPKLGKTEQQPAINTVLRREKLLWNEENSEQCSIKCIKVPWLPDNKKHLQSARLELSRYE